MLTSFRKALAFRLAAAKFLDEMKNQPLRLESQVGEAPAEIEVEGSRLPDQHSMYDVFPKVLQSPGVPGEGEASVIEIQDRLEEFAVSSKSSLSAATCGF